MFNLIRKLFSNSKKVEEVRKVKYTTKNEREVRRCHCGRKTLIRNHSKIIDSNGNVEFTFHIICPNCQNDVVGKGKSLDEAKNNAITKWNRSNHMNEVLVERGRKQVVKFNVVGRPRKATL